MEVEYDILIKKTQGVAFRWKLEKLENTGLKIVDVGRKCMRTIAASNGLQVGDIVTKVYDETENEYLNIFHEDFDLHCAELMLLRIYFRRFVTNGSVERELSFKEKQRQNRLLKRQKIEDAKQRENIAKKERYKHRRNDPAAKEARRKNYHFYREMHADEIEQQKLQLEKKQQKEERKKRNMEIYMNSCEHHLDAAKRQRISNKELPAIANMLSNKKKNDDQIIKFKENDEDILSSILPTASYAETFLSPFNVNIESYSETCSSVINGKIKEEQNSMSSNEKDLRNSGNNCPLDKVECNGISLQKIGNTVVLPLVHLLNKPLDVEHRTQPFASTTETFACERTDQLFESDVNTIQNYYSSEQTLSTSIGEKCLMNFSRLAKEALPLRGGLLQIGKTVVLPPVHLSNSTPFNLDFYPDDDLMILKRYNLTQKRATIEAKLKQIELQNRLFSAEIEANFLKIHNYESKTRSFQLKYTDMIQDMNNDFDNPTASRSLFHHKLLKERCAVFSAKLCKIDGNMKLLDRKSYLNNSQMETNESEKTKCKEECKLVKLNLVKVLDRLNNVDRRFGQSSEKNSQWIELLKEKRACLSINLIKMESKLKLIEQKNRLIRTEFEVIKAKKQKYVEQCKCVEMKLSKVKDILENR